jgi:hypothetical protein
MTTETNDAFQEFIQAVDAARTGVTRPTWK